MNDHRNSYVSICIHPTHKLTLSATLTLTLGVTLTLVLATLIRRLRRTMSQIICDTTSSI